MGCREEPSRVAGERRRFRVVVHWKFGLLLAKEFLNERVRILVGIVQGPGDVPRLLARALLPRERVMIYEWDVFIEFLVRSTSEVQGPCHWGL